VERELELLLSAAAAGAGDTEYARGRWHSRRGDFRGAIRRLEAAATSTPTAGHWFRLGEAQERSGDRRAAAASLARAVQMDSGHGPARSASAVLALGDGDVAGALTQVGAASDPLSLRRALVDAEIGLRLGQGHEARAAIEHVVRRVAWLPPGEVAIGPVAELYAGLARLPGMSDSAIAGLEAAAESMPTVLDWRLSAAQLAARLDGPARALRNYDAALAMGPSVEAWIGRSQALAALGQHADARTALARARGLEPWNLSILRLQERDAEPAPR
jgi:tetratricopeptide (TPR) repeat protein